MKRLMMIRTMKSFPVKLIPFAALLILATACGSSRDKLTDRIQMTEKEYYSPVGGLRLSQADSLLALYLDFAEKFPKDTLAPDFLFRAAALNNSLERTTKAMELFDRYIKEYPDMEMASQCLFMKATLYEDKLRDLEKARETYSEFIVRYPDDDFADDASIAIQTLGMSLEERILWGARQKAMADSTRKADSLAALASKK